MARWRRLIQQTETQVDRLRGRLDARVGDKPLLIQSYLGYGTPERAFLLGRVLEDKGITPSEADASLWENFRGTLKRFRSNEVPHARIGVAVGGALQEIIADDEGHLSTWLPLPPGVAQAGELLSLQLTLLEPQREGTPLEATASVLIPGPGARFGVISDIDDTVLQTGATSLRSLARQVLFGNAHTRLPFEGVAAFYEALGRGRGAEENPLFYVSSSPWNLYDVLVQFMELNDIPLGPLLLRDWGIGATELLPLSHGAHKRHAIEQILTTYPELPFILIGDSGQEDPEIYHQVVHDFPERILALYIRDVSARAGRRESVLALAREVEAAGSFLLLSDDTRAAAEHAALQGWIAAEGVERVAERRAEDLAQPR
ncbi:App1 family protein [Truepera radiovictrix]|nr:phosphatase domain-containing protein [Truepera radiovictrix]WMT57100.1 DUF2183 domain-containing protein [Truepera radiovictrix]